MKITCNSFKVDEDAGCTNWVHTTVTIERGRKTRAYQFESRPKPGNTFGIPFCVEIGRPEAALYVSDRPR